MTVISQIMASKVSRVEKCRVVGPSGRVKKRVSSRVLEDLHESLIRRFNCP